MWETIRAVLTSSIAISTLTFLAVCLIGAFVLIKTGFLQIHTSAIQVGAADMERTIIRQQLDYVHLHLEAFERGLPKPENYNEYLGKYIVEQVYDEYVNWVTQNHINKTSSYIAVKQDRIVSIVMKFTIKDEFRTKKFENYIRDDTEKTILTLIQIRENAMEVFK